MFGVKVKVKVKETSWCRVENINKVNKVRRGDVIGMGLHGLRCFECARETDPDKYSANHSFLRSKNGGTVGIDPVCTINDNSI